MREVDLELDYCPKCEPEETQDPFPTQSFKFFYMFSVAVKCVNWRNILCSVAPVGRDRNDSLFSGCLDR